MAHKGLYYPISQGLRYLFPRTVGLYPKWAANTYDITVPGWIGSISADMPVPPYTSFIEDPFGEGSPRSFVSNMVAGIHGVALRLFFRLRDDGIETEWSWQITVDGQDQISVGWFVVGDTAGDLNTLFTGPVWFGTLLFGFPHFVATPYS